MKNNILKAYEDDSKDLIKRFEDISSAELLAPVFDYLPKQPSDILDVGAGTGRDAAWLASLSHRVVAVEPVDALRNAGIEVHKSPNISWVYDTLPHLSHTVTLGKTFDVLLLCAVWQHLDDTDRQIAFSKFGKLIRPNGKIIMSIRHGTAAPSRSVYPSDISNIIAWAENQGFSMLSEIPAQSIQTQNRQDSVTWTWLVFQANLK